jgi:integrase
VNDTETTATPTYIRVEDMGSLMLHGRTWWIRYSSDGKRHQENSHSADVSVARKLLKLRFQELGQRRRVDPSSEAKVKMGELFDALVTEYTNNGRRSLPTLQFRLTPLREFFGHMKARDVNGSTVERYKRERRAEEMAPATINRELAALRRAFTIAIEQDRLSSAPTVKMFTEDNARQGFVNPGDFDAIVAELRTDVLQDMARLGYLCGWRSGELKTLGWPDVDRTARRITLRREHSKTREPRVIPMTPEIAAIIERRWSLRALGCVHVFHRNGQPVKSFRNAWEGACERAGHPGLLFHDLRRSAVRNLTSSGVDQAVAMKITGHKTDSVYPRYRIVDESDNRAGAAEDPGVHPAGASQ